jgi:hypothetical protein
MRLHFGLADAQKVDSVSVLWPSGKRENFTTDAINKLIELKENSAK